MSNSMISPRYKMQLVSEVTDAIWGRYHSYAKARTFIEMFQHNEYDSDGVYSGQNFEIVKKVGAEIDLLRTLANGSPGHQAGVSVSKRMRGGHLK